MHPSLILCITPRSLRRLTAQGDQTGGQSHPRLPKLSQSRAPRRGRTQQTATRRRHRARRATFLLSLGKHARQPAFGTGSISTAPIQPAPDATTASILWGLLYKNTTTREPTNWRAITSPPEGLATTTSPSMRSTPPGNCPLERHSPIFVNSRVSF